MSSIWTPGGEHQVPRASQDEGAGGASPPNASGAARASVAAYADDVAELSEEALEDLTDEELSELAEVQRQVLETPVEAVVANHAVNLFQLARLHLSQRPPRLNQA